MSNFVDLRNTTFGKLRVVERSNRLDNTGWRSYWNCVCECGNEVVVHRNNLVSGRTQSCGCFRRKLAVQQATRHSGYGTRLYKTWSDMISRCRNTNATGYVRYGGRGIHVCDAWNDFAVFKEWSINNGYRDDLTIDRIDVNGDYCPENCRWANKRQQANNTTRTRYITWRDETHSLAEWAELTGISQQALWKRMFVRGWSTEKALTTPLFNNGCSRNKEDL